jgi:hypothetical protein
MLEQASGLGSQRGLSSYPDPHNIATARTHSWLAIHGKYRSSGFWFAMPDQAPPPGLYQQLLTEGLEQQLRQLQDTLVATDGLDPQEAPRLLARHLANLPALPWNTSAVAPPLSTSWPW